MKLLIVLNILQKLIVDGMEEYVDLMKIELLLKQMETNSLKVISILNLKIIKEINNPFHCWGITLIEDKGIFIVGGASKDIRIYRNDNYECIQTIQNAHDNYISGFIELKDCSIASFSCDKRIKIWCF